MVAKWDGTVIQMKHASLKSYQVFITVFHSLVASIRSFCPPLYFKTLKRAENTREHLPQSAPLPFSLKKHQSMQGFHRNKSIHLVLIKKVFCFHLPVNLIITVSHAQIFILWSILVGQCIYTELMCVDPSL